jgi:predicted amidophosphoribosyltransferase
MLDFVRTLLFPPACVTCDAPGPALCARCAPSPRDGQTFWLDGVPGFALGPYDGPLRRAIVAMKHGERDPLDAFAEMLAARATIDGELVPLPTSSERAAERGFDQAVELARRVAARRGLPCAQVLVKRGAPQDRRTRRQRLEASGRFAVRRGTQLPQRATLVDDVCTTGATARDAISVLRAAGVDVRRLVVVARTSPPGTNANRAGSLPSP